MHATLRLERFPDSRYCAPWLAVRTTHRATMQHMLVVLLATVLFFATAPGYAADVDFANDTASIHFNDVDQQLFRNTLANALEDEMDGNSRRWVNPKSGNNGRIKIIRTLSPKEPRCRQVRISNTHKERGLKASSVLTYCRDNDANWGVHGGTPNSPIAPADDH